MRWFIYLVTVTAFIISLPEIAMADNSSQIDLYGTLIEPPPCTINNGQDIDVPFGENVGISRVDGVNYKKNVDYQITCDDSSGDNTVTLGLIVNGQPTTFDSAAVQAQIEGSTSTDLGIKLILGGNDFSLNKRVNINKDTPPLLEAVPVKKPGTTLPEGQFTATATLMANYE
jgi:hypothetical protein